MTCFKLKSLVKKNFKTTILFINFLPTAQSLSLYAQLIQEITTSTSLSMQILQVWASSIRRFSFCNHRGCCTFGDLPIYRHLKSSSYTLEVLGLLKIFKSSQYLACKMPPITLVKASIANSKIWLRKSTQRHIILSLLSIAVSPVDPARIGRR